MRPLAITGMHRSGTSMVAHAAQELGLHLGHPDDLMPGTHDNPDGHFEHVGLVAASEALFQQLGAGWDCPPTLTVADLRQPGLDAARDIARPVLAELAAHGAWAWKDPRLATVLPFWLELVPDAGVVICLRNPLEVAASLRARNGTSLALGLRLWFEHVGAATATSTPQLVTHYDAWFHRPDVEVMRLAALAGTDPTPQQREAAAAVAARHLRHARFDALSLRTARVHPELRALYERLLLAADWHDGASELSAAPSANGSTPDRAALGRVRPWVVDVGVARYEVHKRNGRIAQLEQRLADREPVDRAPTSTATDDLQAGIYDLQLAVAELTAQVTNGDDEARARDVAYARMIRDVRDAMRRLVPIGSEVLVVSDGEPALVDLHGRLARHFPVGPSPLTPGSRPVSGIEAVAHLIARQALGATHLVVPSAAGWWLAAYPQLADRLTRAATVIFQADDGTTMHELHRTMEPHRFADAGAALDAARRRLGDEPSVLDATADGVDLDAFRSIVEPAAELPYANASVDVVAIDADAVEPRHADAHRIATTGVLLGGPDGWTWSWTGPLRPVAVDLVLVTAEVPDPATYLSAVMCTLPTAWTGELVVLTPSDRAGSWTGVGDDRVTVRTGAVGETLAELAGRSADGHVVLVDGSAVPLEGWLTALLAPFGRGERVGLVAGRRRAAAGAPVTIAQTVVDAGLRPVLGGGEDGVTAPIDVAVPGVAAWRRSTLAAHPWDDGYRTLAFALADHCRALVASGHECLVQPEAETVDLGVTSVGDAPEADRARLEAALAGVG